MLPPLLRPAEVGIQMLGAQCFWLERAGNARFAELTKRARLHEARRVDDAGYIRELGGQRGNGTLVRDVEAFVANRSLQLFELGACFDRRCVRS